MKKIIPILIAILICFGVGCTPYLSVHGNFYRVDLAYVDNKTTNDYQIIRVPALV